MCVRLNVACLAAYLGKSTRFGVGLALSKQILQLFEVGVILFEFKADMRGAESWETRTVMSHSQFMSHHSILISCRSYNCIAHCFYGNAHLPPLPLQCLSALKPNLLLLNFPKKNSLFLFEYLIKAQNRWVLNHIAYSQFISSLDSTNPTAITFASVFVQR